MKNPYQIKEQGGISFSGGRTSAYMLYRILDSFNGQLPDNLVVTFANTGREMPETLDFVHACSQNWGVDIVWLELGEYYRDGEYKKGSKKGKPIYRAKTNVVTYETASRNGEPFARLIDKRQYLPNPVSRFCTAELKVRRIRKYLNELGYGKNWLQAIGIRADEPRRANKLHGVIDEGHEMYLPLYLDGITKEDIYKFWKAQPFDLQLPNFNGTTDWGNCDLCYLKGSKKKLAIVRERPDLADWWIEQELKFKTTAGTAGLFRGDQPDYATMKHIALNQPSLFDDQIDETIPCYCGE